MYPLFCDSDTAMPIVFDSVTNLCESSKDGLIHIE